ncbi:MAG TPA: MFS transporter [Thermomicrobiales bacterium]|nr:MFS transporter [Thermomicrobiales bacterium]
MKQLSVRQAATAPSKLDLKIIVPLSLAASLGAINSLATSPLLPVMAAGVGTSVAAIGQTVTALLVMAAISGLVIGPLADTFGQRRSMVLGLLVSAASALGTAVAPTYPLLMASRLVGGIGAAVTFGVPMGVAGASFSGDARRRAVSLVSASIAMTSIAGVPIVTLLESVAGWRGAFAILSSGMLATGLLVNRLLPPDAGDDKRSTLSLRDIGRAYIPLLANRRMIALFGATALFAGGWLGSVTYMGAFLIATYDLSVPLAGVAYMIGGAGFFLGNLLGGGRIGAFGLARVCGVSVTLLALGWATFYSVGGSYGWIAALAILAPVGVAGGVGIVCLNTLVATETPAGPSTTMVLRGSVFSLGAALGALLGGGALALFGYAALAVAMPPFLFASAVWVWRAGRHVVDDVNPRG